LHRILYSRAELWVSSALAMIGNRSDPLSIAPAGCPSLRVRLQLAAVAPGDPGGARAAPR
jgi:hypothetical protein